MISGSRSSPAMTSAGSPGNRCCSEKIRIDTKNSVGISCRMRLARKFSMVLVSRAQRGADEPRSLQRQPGHAHQPVRHLLVTFQPGGMCDQDPAVKDIENGLFVEHGLRCLLYT